MHNYKSIKVATGSEKHEVISSVPVFTMKYSDKINDIQ